jgi:hypothetical protein
MMEPVFYWMPYVSATDVQYKNGLRRNGAQTSSWIVRHNVLRSLSYLIPFIQDSVPLRVFLRFKKVV